MGLIPLIMRHLVAQLREAAKKYDLANPDLVWVQENKIKKQMHQILCQPGK